MKDLSALLVLVCLLLAYWNSKAHFLNVDMSHLLNMCSVNTFRFKSFKIYFSACVFVYVPCVCGVCVGRRRLLLELRVVVRRLTCVLEPN